MVTKINVSISKEILQKADLAAREEHTSRSAFIVRAVEHFLQEKENERAQERRRKAAEGMDRIRGKLGAWDATGKILKWRELH
ncbi:MAG: hypothetical protein HY673_01320 [Chloroflexi bacterium]|nr:hypothetical protein [Chloroflexota bacterium]